MSEQDFSLKESAPLTTGALLDGKYRIQRLLAEGGMGSVFHAIQEPLGRDVAVKTLKSEPGLSALKLEERTKRFFREASLCSRLNHPNTITIFDYGRLGEEGFFLAMEFLRGGTLRDLMNAQGALDVELSVHIATQIASSLADAHKAGVVHRDLKPPNVMLVERGGDPHFVKVVDFGLIKEVGNDSDEELTGDNVVLGSPLYMAPERFMEKGVDIPAIDVYALGITLYEMLVGRPPFVRPPESTMHRLIVSHAQEEPPPLRTFAPRLLLPDGLETLIMRMLAKFPEERPSMEAVTHLLRACLKAGIPHTPHEKPTFSATPYVPPAQDTSDRLLPELIPQQTSEQTRVDLPTGPHPTQTGPHPYAPAHPQTGPHTFAPLPYDPNARSSSSRTPLLVGVGLLLVLLGAMALYAATRGPQQLQMTISSAPAGAEVWRGPVMLGTTPLTTTLPYEGPAMLEIRQEGYLPYTYRLPESELGAIRVDAQLVARELPAGEKKDPSPKEIEAAPSDVGTSPETVTAKDAPPEVTPTPDKKEGAGKTGIGKSTKNTRNTKGTRPDTTPPDDPLSDINTSR